MRALSAVLVLTFALSCSGTAGAADYYAAGPSRAGQVYVYDNQPGVFVRAYWSEPWQHRHYYPSTGIMPKVGRHERMSDVRPAPKPAETYYRAWSTNSLYPPPPVRVPADIDEPYVARPLPPLVPHR